MRNQWGPLHSPTMRCSILCVALLGTLTACSEPAPLAPSTPAPPSEAPSASPSAPAAAAPAPGSLGPEAAGGLVWEGRSPLVRRAPKTNMRAAEYGLEGEAQAELGVFYFGPDQGGTVDANVARWLGQIKQPDGSDTMTKAVREQATFGGVQVTTIEATGSFSGGMAMPGMAPPAAIADAMLLGAIANGPKGPVFFKLTGPRAAVEKARAGFRGMLETLRVDPKLSP
jgi:hypothetical protein